MISSTLVRMLSTYRTVHQVDGDGGIGSPACAAAPSTTRATSSSGYDGASPVATIATAQKAMPPDSSRVRLGGRALGGPPGLL